MRNLNSFLHMKLFKSGMHFSTLSRCSVAVCGCNYCNSVALEDSSRMGIDKLFNKGPDSKYCNFCKPYDFSHN